VRQRPDPGGVDPVVVRQQDIHASSVVGRPGGAVDRSRPV
ncbi:MAG: hypothetical protein ACI9CA_001899, partial [Natronomonas sp.]